MNVLWIIIAIVVILLLFGGIGYGRRDAWGNYYGGGIGILGLILIILLILWLLGVFNTA